MRFELDFLTEYTESSMIEEIRRVSLIVGGEKLTQSEFKKHSKVGLTTLRTRFGNWENALKMAGLSDRFDDSTAVISKETLVKAIKDVVQIRGADTNLTIAEFSKIAKIDQGPVRRVFGTWANALKELGLEQSSLGKRYSDEQCHENMLRLWMAYGRVPMHAEANKPPSEVGAKAYILRWGTWRKALQAFVSRAQKSDGDENLIDDVVAVQIESKSIDSIRDSRYISLSLRYFVLKRDRFRCVTCGRSPATHLQTTLHLDHIHPWSMGGRTEVSNLRVLCVECNLGKGVSHADKT
jgi:hypothetical protein